MQVETERSGKVFTVIINRPEVKNAIDYETSRQLAEAFRAFEADGEACAAVLWGAHGTFCAGADLKALAADPMQEALRLNEDMAADGPLGPTRMLLSKPVIAAISGYCVAGGLELAVWCDLRVAEEDAVLGIFERRFGVPLIDGGTQRLPRLIGMSRALDMILTGRPVGAQEALEMGLVNRVVGEGEGQGGGRGAGGAARRVPPDLHAQRPRGALPRHRDDLRRGAGDGIRAGHQDAGERGVGLRRRAFHRGRGQTRHVLDGVAPSFVIFADTQSFNRRLKIRPHARVTRQGMVAVSPRTVMGVPMAAEKAATWRSHTTASVPPMRAGLPLEIWAG